MTFEDTPLGFDQPLPPLGTLKAIDLHIYPETHLQPFQSEHHQDELQALVRHALGGTAVDLTRLMSNDLSAAAVDKPAEQLVTDLAAHNRLTLLLFEGTWRHRGSLLGYLSLQQAVVGQILSRATFTAVAGQDSWAKSGLYAAENLFAYGAERWGIEGVVLPQAMTVSDTVYPSDGYLSSESLYDIIGTWGSRLHFLLNTRRFYSSRFGTITTSLHGGDGFDELLSEDIAVSQKEVIINGLNSILHAWEDVLAVCKDARESRGVSVEINIPRAPVSKTEHRIVDACMDAGVKVQLRGGLPGIAIIDRRKYYKPAYTNPRLDRYGLVRCVEAEREMPFPIIQFGTLV